MLCYFQVTVTIIMGPWLGLMMLLTRVTCQYQPRARSHFQHQLPGEGSMMSVSREFSGTFHSPGSESGL